MRLIDSDDVIIVFTNRLFETLKTNLPCVTAEENQICLDTCYKVAKHEIDNISTAYDVDKVVEELEERSKEYNLGVRLHGKPEEMRTYEAIEIVRNGGKE